MIKVSVCITTYNLEFYIAQTLDSVLCQETEFEYEVIVGDDFSTDKTREILLQYKERYPNKIVLHFQKENVGVNRNDYDLIHLAKGEYIAWCDGDDYWLTKDKLQKQVDILDANPEFSCVHTNWINYFEVDGSRKPTTKHPKDWEYKLKGDKYVERLIAGDTSGCRFSSLMYRKALVLDFLSKDSSVYLSVPHKQNDFALLCILSYYGPFYLLPEYTTAYRIREVSLSMGNDAKKRVNYTIAYLYLLAYLLKAFNINKNIVYIAIKRNVGAILHFMYNNRTNNWCVEFNELTVLMSQTRYAYSYGQLLQVYAIRNNVVFWLTKPLFYLLRCGKR